MKFAHLLTLAAALSPALSLPARAADEEGLAPSSPWALHYDPDSCVMGRWFGTGDERAYVEFRRFQPGRELQVVVASNEMEARATVEPFRYRFRDEDKWESSGDRLTMKLADGFSGVLFSASFVELPDYDDIDGTLEKALYLHSLDLNAIEKEQVATIRSITLRGAFPRELRLRLGPITKAVEALQTCTQDLTTHWGIDVEAHKTLSRPAIPVNLREVPRMMDYPPAMLRLSMPGLVNVRLAIDETGRITACHIQMPLSDPAFEESSCADIQHALDFDPALDKDGKPIASYWITSVHFSLGY